MEDDNMPYLSNEIKNLCEQGFSQKQIAKILDCSLNTVRRRMKELSIFGKSKGQRLYKINESVFENIDTEEKAYWLGFILADGCIAKSAGTRRAFRLGLKASDKGHLKKAAQFFNYKGKFHPDNRDNHPRLGIVFNSVRLCNHLLDKGWMEYKKNGGIRIFGFVPKNLNNHLIRGYFDGDGCISYWRGNKKWYFCIVCKNSLPLEYFRSIIRDNTGIDREVKMRGNAFVLLYNGAKKINQIMNWLYKDSTVYLDRKYIRKQEIDGNEVYSWSNLHNFEFFYNSSQVVARRDCDNIKTELVDHIIAGGWKNPKFKPEIELNKCKNIDISRYIDGDEFINKRSFGRDLIMHFQPLVWQVSQNRKPYLANLSNHRSMVVRAVDNFINTPNKKLYPERLLREFQFVGFTRASILSVPIIMAVIKKLGLVGKWFDPCAGWGNRLLAAYLLNMEYCGTDPGVSFNGLVALNNFLNANAEIENKKFQDVTMEADFVFTSPPFHDKEDYLSGEEYGTFDSWADDFLKTLVERSLVIGRTVLHVDKAMKEWISERYNTKSYPLLSLNRHKVPKEWFVEVKTHA